MSSGEDPFLEAAVSRLHLIYTYLETYRAQRPYVTRISKVVQENQDFFGDPAAGSFTLAVACEKLESLVEAYRKEREADSGQEHENAN